ncbi:MAG TPA: hypothetical protein VMV57_02480 [Terracidiphilus sp.]|nr:hypothetical protein [Terracidiphilus sp.]
MIWNGTATIAADAQHSLDLSNQRTLTDLQTHQFAASVQLIRALGCGWDVTQLPK